MHVASSAPAGQARLAPTRTTLAADDPARGATPKFRTRWLGPAVLRGPSGASARAQVPGRGGRGGVRCASSGRKAGEKEGSTPERNAPERNWSLQQRQGHRWHEGLLWPNELPHIDWTRYHIKVLFVDQSHKYRSRLAEGLLSHIADWNGYGRALYPASRGLQADQNAYLELSEASTLLYETNRLHLPTHIIKEPCERFAIEEVDHYDLIIALVRPPYDLTFSLELDESNSFCARPDEVTLESIFAMMDDEYREEYERKVLCLGMFAQYATKEQLLESGAFGLLDRRLREILAEDLEQLRSDPSASLVPRVVPRAQEGVGAKQEREKWQRNISSMILSCAGLVRYLMDANPDDLDGQWLDY